MSTPLNSASMPRRSSAVGLICRIQLFLSNTIKPSAMLLTTAVIFSASCLSCSSASFRFRRIALNSSTNIPISLCVVTSIFWSNFPCPTALAALATCITGVIILLAKITAMGMTTKQEIKVKTKILFRSLTAGRNAIFAG